MSFLDEYDALDPSQPQEPMGSFFKYVLTDTAAMFAELIATGPPW